MDYILGVDGGNTKTDYYLCDQDGNIIDMYRDGTCSHERLRDHFEGTYRVMKHVFDKFLTRNGLTTADISAACFGLAGDDVPSQQVALEIVVSRLGFKNYIVCNDSMLGIKIGTSKGYGGCSVNGTGTSASAVGVHGDKIQVGGIGELTADEGGGRFLARKAIRRVWDEAYRFGKKTSLTPIVFKAFKIKDKSQLMEAISVDGHNRDFNYDPITLGCFEEANKGDEVARQILIDMGECLGRNLAGAIMNVSHDEHPEVVLIGSVYVKGSCPLLVETFKETVNKYTGLECKFSVLQVPPATGAVAWAKEMYDGRYLSAEEKAKIIKNVSLALEEKEKQEAV